VFGPDPLESNQTRLARILRRLDMRPTAGGSNLLLAGLGEYERPISHQGVAEQNAVDAGDEG
jgi:hypothetical protein